MAKRFTDSDIWKKKWFRTLPPSYKCMWRYMTDMCDHAGIYEPDFEMAAMYIGEEITYYDTIKFLGNHLVVLDNGRWFLTDFIPFQYKCAVEELNPLNKVHASVTALLKSNGVSKVLARGMHGDKDKDKDKDKDLEQDKDQAKDKNKEEDKELDKDQDKDKSKGLDDDLPF